MATAARLKLRAAVRRHGHPAWCAAFALLIAAGCGREERTQTEFTPALERTSVIGDSTSLLALSVSSLPDTVAADTASARAATLRLDGLGESALRGEVTLTHAGSATRVRATLADAAGRQTYDGMIRRGTCAQIGSRVSSLVPATADSLGAASSITDVPVPLRALHAAPHVIVFGRNYRPQTCGAL